MEEKEGQNYILTDEDSDEDYDDIYVTLCVSFIQNVSQYGIVQKRSCSVLYGVCSVLCVQYCVCVTCCVGVCVCMSMLCMYSVLCVFSVALCAWCEADDVIVSIVELCPDKEL